MGPGTGNLSQNGQKPTPLMTSFTKIPKPKIFFHCNRENLQRLQRVWIAL